MSTPLLWLDKRRELARGFETQSGMDVWMRVDGTNIDGVRMFELATVQKMPNGSGVQMHNGSGVQMPHVKGPLSLPLGKQLRKLGL